MSDTNDSNTDTDTDGEQSDTGPSIFDLMKAIKESTPPADRGDIDSTTRQRRTDHGVSITTEVKRGTGTRDQDKHVIKSKGADFDEAREYHNAALDYLDGGSRSDAAVIDRVREWDPDREVDQDNA